MSSERKKPSEMVKLGLLQSTDAGTIEQVVGLYRDGPLGNCQDCSHWRDIGNAEGICYLGKPMYTTAFDQCHRYERMS